MNEMEIAADTVLFTPGAHPRAELQTQLQERFPQAACHVIGNSKQSGRAIDAIREGCFLASEI